MTAFD